MSDILKCENIIIIVVIVIIASMMINNNEGMNSIHDSSVYQLTIDNNIITDLPNGYKKCAEDGGLCTYNGNNDVYYGSRYHKRFAKIPKKYLKTDNKGRFTCLPITYTSGYNLDVLPVSDPAPYVVKSCYVM